MLQLMWQSRTTINRPMKILNLHFKNINSLEGETRIDFTAAPFANTGVFAITGPNGSGKSSILDAITLALYGETFRFDKPAAHVMTKQTNDCFAVVEFSLGAEKYQSGWRVEKIGNEFKPAEMQLIRLTTGEILANTPQQVCQQMTDLTGMNFRNFTRAVLLAQGDFAAFLCALDNERMDILEKIISSDIYADYKKDITDKAEKAQQTIKQTQEQLAAISLLPPEKIEASEHDLTDFKEQYAEVAAQNKQLKEQQAAIKNIAVIQAQVNVQKKNLKQAKQEAEQLKQQLETIASHQDTAIYQAEYDNIQQQEQTIKQQKTELVSLQSELIALKTQFGNRPVPNTEGKTLAEQQQQINESKTQLGAFNANLQAAQTLAQSLEAQIAEKQAHIADLTNWLEQHQADASLLEHFPDLAKLNRLRAELIELNAQHKRISKQSKEAAAALNGNTHALEKEQARLAAATGELAQDEQDLAALQAQYSLERLTELRNEQQERVKDFQEMYDIAVVYQRLSKTSSGLFSWLNRKKAKADEIDLMALEQQHEELKQEVLREENIKIVLERAVLQESLLKKMAEHREHLIDGKPCPLCGALDHPYSQKPPVVRSSQQALHNQQAKIKNLLARTYEVGRQLEAAKHRAEHATSTWARRQRLSSQWFILANRLNAYHPDLSIDNLDLMTECLKTETEEFKNITALAISYREKQHNIVKLNNAIEKSTATIERLKAAVDGFAADSIARSEQQIETEKKLQQTQQEEQQVAEQVIQQLMALGEKIPAKNKEDLLFERLTARKQDYQHHLLQRKALQEDIVVLTEKRVACETEIKHYQQQIELVSKRLQTEESLGLQLTILEKQQLIAAKEQLIAEQNNQLNQQQQALLAKIAPALTSLTALNDILVLLKSKDKLAQQLERLNADITAKTQTMEKTSAELEIAFKLAETALSPEQLTMELKRTAEQMELASLEMRRLERLLEEQRTLQSKQSRLNAQLKQQEAEAQPYLAELASLTADNGRVFRRKVQQQLADRLLAQTNAILEKISGRYYLRQLPSEQGLALVIEDTLQGNLQRLPKTLSGGESFVVSLALALGLAEMASNGRSVDSLFIDEGFGNLDAETLYIIISTLENLQTQGKTVGVISHVEAIQKRFKAQLQVVKKPNGMGMLQQAV